LVGRGADKQVLLRFGLPAIIAAFFGSWLLLKIPDATALFTYEILGKTFEVFAVKLIVSVLLIIFAFTDIVPYFGNVHFGKDKLPIGGFLSGFFGGLSGNQGALRSAFLIKAGLSKEAFVATAVVVSTCVDFTRLSVYATRFAQPGLEDHLELISYATLAGIAGSYLGNRFLKKVTLRFLQIIVAIALITLSIALGAGII
jgi:uncharacterized protein